MQSQLSKMLELTVGTKRKDMTRASGNDFTTPAERCFQRQPSFLHVTTTLRAIARRIIIRGNTVLINSHVLKLEPAEAMGKQSDGIMMEPQLMFVQPKAPCTQLV